MMQCVCWQQQQESEGFPRKGSSSHHRGWDHEGVPFPLVGRSVGGNHQQSAERPGNSRRGGCCPPSLSQNTPTFCNWELLLPPRVFRS
jgi:hypothetical protein